MPPKSEPGTLSGPYAAPICSCSPAPPTLEAQPLPHLGKTRTGNTVEIHAGISASSDNCTWEQLYEQPHHSPLTCHGVPPFLLQLWHLSPDRPEPPALSSHLLHCPALLRSSRADVLQKHEQEVWERTFTFNKYKSFNFSILISAQTVALSNKIAPGTLILNCISWRAAHSLF